MDALFALACTLPPSAALVAGAFVWLQRERDRRLNDAHVAAIHLHTQSVGRIDMMLEASNEDRAQLAKRVADAEQQISRLTDRLHG